MLQVYKTLFTITVKVMDDLGEAFLRLFMEV